MMSRQVIALVLCASSLGCNAARSVKPPAIVQNVERSALETAVGWGNASPDAVMLLTAEFIRDGRIGEGRAFFGDLMKAHPDEALFRGVEAFFRLLSADEVFLLRRIAWVEDALRTMDAVVETEPSSPVRYLRAVAMARLPESFGRQQLAVEELEAMTARGSPLPPNLLHNAYRALAQAYAAVGRKEEAQQALTRSGYKTLQGDEPDLSTFISVDLEHGTRYGPPSFQELEPGVFAALSYDFADIYFVLTANGVVAIDAGASVDRTRQVKALLRDRTALPITHVIQTHAHWDHVGGLEALREPGTQVIIGAGYEETVEAIHAIDTERLPSFLGQGADGDWRPEPDVVIRERQALDIGGVTFELVPLAGGETDDSMMVHVPSKKVLFAGDVVSSLGTPYFNEGSAEGFIRALRTLGEYPEARVLHGHYVVGTLLTPEALAPLATALETLRADAVADIHQGRTLADLVRKNVVPQSLRSHPKAVVPYVLWREPFLRTLHHRRTGPWRFDGEGLEVHSVSELGRALDLVAGGRPDAFEDASNSLLERGDFGLAWRVAELGLGAHPQHMGLARVRSNALRKLLEKHQSWDFFRLTVYSEAAGIPIPPVPDYR